MPLPEAEKLSLLLEAFGPFLLKRVMIPKTQKISRRALHYWSGWAKSIATDADCNKKFKPGNKYFRTN